MLKITIAPAHPLSPTHDDLEELIAELRQVYEDLSVEVRVPPPQRGYGLTYFELITVLVDLGNAVAGELVTLTIGGVIKRMITIVKRWYQARRKQTGGSRPLAVTFADEKGNVLAKIEVSMKDGKARVVTRSEPAARKPRKVSATPRPRKPPSPKKPSRKNPTE